eukprot:NODE_3_length_80033_cov_0.932970.p24 type:complete len:333 gc:universal NODE_3_length_80033_cov_0.932970:59019-60017(+)
MEINLCPAFDAHIHLRQGEMMESVTKLIAKGGASTVYVMPNLSPPITTIQQAVEYKNRLKEIDDSIIYLMSLYLVPSITDNDLIRAKNCGVYGVKWYPKGVTTKSDLGVENIESCYRILKIMEREDLILNIHGEVPFSTESISVLNAEERFIPTLIKIRKDFPALKIVMEHVTTKKMMDAIISMDDRIGATITVHHLDITVNDWAGNSLNFCKPVAKSPEDRAALWNAIKSKNPRIFLGSDSAPHGRSDKLKSPANAGIFTSPILLPYLAQLFESQQCVELLENFSSTFGRQFYNLPKETHTITLRENPKRIPRNPDVPYFKEDILLKYEIK